nr:unnamed protein product [Callosobruchus chinensis]
MAKALALEATHWCWYIWSDL